MKVGIPKETSAGETRVAASPETVKKMRARGLDVIVEVNAGLSAHFTDEHYREAGAEVGTAAQALAADIVLKVAKPTKDEIGKLKKGAALASFLDVCNDDGSFDALAAANISAFSLELVPRISRAQSVDALSSQSNIAGYRAVLEGARLYGRFFPMMMTSAGSAKPARVAVLGAGVAGLQAIATARRLGAQVSAYDVRPETKEQINSLGAKFIELALDEDATGTGGYAKQLSADAQQRQRQLLGEELKKFDIIISTAAIPCKPAPVLITEDAVKGMRQGTVIVDMAAASGGNCPLTEADKVVVKHGVTLCGITNYAALMPSDASSFYARNLYNLLQLMLDDKSKEPKLLDFLQDEITAASLVTHQGAVRYKRS